jgi:hypothetical protein
MAKRRKSAPKDFWSFISSNLVKAENISDSEYIEPKYSLPEVDPVHSWTELKERFHGSGLYLTPGNEHAIAACVATVISTYIPGEPIWLFFVGLPSSGKTTIIESFGSSNMYCEAQSELHSTMLVSGAKSADGRDVSFLPTLKQRTLLIKDYTTVVSMDHKSQEKLYAILRDAFDGTYKKQYGNGEIRCFTGIKFGMIAGVTKVIHGDSRSSLGERFLKIEYHEEDEFDEHTHALAAMRSSSRKAERTEILQRSMLGFVDHLISNMPDEESRPKVAEESEFEGRVIQLALLVSYLRAQVDRRGDDSLLYRPGKEIASRLSVQFKKVSECLMLIFGLTEPNELIYNVLRKLAIDSCIPFNVEFARILHNHPEGISRNELEFELQIPSTNVHRICNDLLQLGIIRVRAESNGKKSGRPKHVYVLNPVIASLWDATVESDFNVRVQSEAPVVRRRKQNESSSVSSDQSVELPERNQTRRRVKRTPNRTLNET